MEQFKKSNNEQPEDKNILSSMPSFEEFRQNVEKTDNINETGIENEQVFESLDNNFDLSNEDKYCLIGLVGGIKQATEIVVYAEHDEEAQVSSDTETILNGLGLKYIKEVEQSDYDPNYSDIQYYVAKTEDKAKQVRDLFEARQQESSAGEATRELGRLFGFPETAIDYFIKRNQSEVPDDINATSKQYGRYIHSPENAEAECQQYEQKIDPLFKKYCPASAEEFLES